jgi:hypothetical protein
VKYTSENGPCPTIGYYWYRVDCSVFVLRVSPVSTSLQVESQDVALCRIVSCACVSSSKHVLCCVLILNVFVFFDIRCLAFHTSTLPFLTPRSFSLSYVLTKRTYFPLSHYLIFSFRDLWFNLSVVQYVTLIKAWESWCI